MPLSLAPVPKSDSSEMLVTIYMSFCKRHIKHLEVHAELESGSALEAEQLKPQLQGAECRATACILIFITVAET